MMAACRGAIAAALALSVLPSVTGQRAIHWVIRVSDLSATLNFTSGVLGMKVLRHEENDQPCPLTCNGVFDTPWSKTMVGFGPEDGHYALELTYNCAPQNLIEGERPCMHSSDGHPGGAQPVQRGRRDG